MRYALAFFVLLALAWGGEARAQQQVIPMCPTGAKNAGGAPLYAPCGNPSGPSVIVTGPTATYQGTLSLSATTSTAISTLTLSNSTTFPAAIGKMIIINTGSNSVNICWFGGTCGTGSGSEPLPAGASDTIYLGAATTSPTAYSTAGTTLAIHN